MKKDFPWAAIVAIVLIVIIGAIFLFSGKREIINFNKKDQDHSVVPDTETPEAEQVLVTEDTENVSESDAQNDTVPIIEQGSVEAIIVPLAVVTRSASNVNEDSALLRGFIQEEGHGNVTVWFEWDNNRNRLLNDDGQILSVNGGYSRGASIEKILYSLDSDDTYYYRFCGKDAEQNQNCGTVQEFTTDEQEIIVYDEEEEEEEQQNDEEDQVQVIDEVVTINFRGTETVGTLAITLQGMRDMCTGMCWEDPVVDLELRYGSNGQYIENRNNLPIGTTIQVASYTINVEQINMSSENVTLHVTN